MTKKLPEITMNDWLEAEQEVALSRYSPQPEGSMTPGQYAAATNRSEIRAREILLKLFNAGKVTREPWLRPPGKVGYVYYLNDTGKTKRSI